MAILKPPAPDEKIPGMPWSKGFNRIYINCMGVQNKSAKRFLGVKKNNRHGRRQ